MSRNIFKSFLIVFFVVILLSCRNTVGQPITEGWYLNQASPGAGEEHDFGVSEKNLLLLGLFFAGGIIFVLLRRTQKRSARRK